MPVKTIMLPLRESDMSEHMLDSAMVLAKQHGAHLDVLFVHPDSGDMLPFATIGITRSMRDMVRDRAVHASKDEAARLEKLFQQVRSRHGVAARTRQEYAGEAGADWTETEGVRSVQVARRGRLADLILTPRPERANPPPRTFEAILRETGRPVLLVPRGEAITQPLTGHVLIGWNGSTEAASAVAASRPLLRTASRTTVLVSTKRQHQRPHGNDVVDYLRCHGVEATCHVVDMSDMHVGEAILAQCRELEIGLLVVGGYSRTRLHEMLLGGVTRHLLEKATLPVFIVH